MLQCRWLLAVSLSAGCATMQRPPQCTRGQSLSAGQCLPTPALVFSHCVESFRKTSVEHTAGKKVAVGGRAQAVGSAEFEHQTQAHDRSEYASVPAQILPEALAECRRQEEEERDNQLERAWAAATHAETRAELAEAAATEARRGRTRAEASRETLVAELATQQETVAELTAAFDSLELARNEEQAQLALSNPCLAQQWDRCGALALASKRSGDYARAHDLFQQACDNGDDAKACANWGVMFEEGLGAPADPVAAYGRYAHACDLGSAEACVSQGVMSLVGQGTSRAVGRAAGLFEEACGDGVARACARLGRMIERGETRATERTPDGLYEGACDAGFLRGCVWLGDLRRRGTSRQSPQPARAAQAYLRACDGGDGGGCLRLADQYAAGDGVPEDPRRARALALQACQSGLARACAAPDVRVPQRAAREFQ